MWMVFKQNSFIIIIMSLFMFINVLHTDIGDDDADDDEIYSNNLIL